MKRFNPSITASQIVSLIGGELVGRGDLDLDSVAEPKDALASSIVFIEQEKLLKEVEDCHAALIICTDQFRHLDETHNLLIVEKPYFCVMKLVYFWLAQAPQPIWGRGSGSTIDATAVIENETRIGNNVIIGKNCRIGKGTIVGDNCFIGDDSVIGENCVINHNVTLYPDTLIGSRVILHSGVVLGADGFGFLLMDGKQIKIPQIGNVIIGNDVEIGSNSTIDRATFGSTIVGDGTKIDNLVQVGHNCRIGKHCILCAQVGLAGSTIVEDYVYLAGQVGIAGHVTIGKGAMIGAQSGVTCDIEPGAKFFGSPAREAGLTKRIIATEKYLPEMYRAYLKSQKQN